MTQRRVVSFYSDQATDRALHRLARLYPSSSEIVRIAVQHLHKSLGAEAMNPEPRPVVVTDAEKKRRDSTPNALLTNLNYGIEQPSEGCPLL
jgi:hypothetical protein